MLSAQTIQAFRNKLQAVLTTRWSTTVAEWNDSQSSTSFDQLPIGPQWTINVGAPENADSGQLDGAPSITITFPQSRYSTPTTLTRQEDLTVRVITYIPDGPRGLTTTVNTSNFASRMIGDLIEKHVIDSPGDTETSACYRVDWVDSEIMPIEGGTGAITRLDLLAKLRSEYQYKPTTMPTVTLPNSNRQNFVFGINYEILDGATPVVTETGLNFGEFREHTLSDATSLVVQPVTGNPWTHGFVVNDEYLLVNQVVPVTFNAGVATVDLTSFAALSPADTLALRVNLISSTTKRSTYFVITLVKS